MNENPQYLIDTRSVKGIIGLITENTKPLTGQLIQEFLKTCLRPVKKTVTGFKLDHQDQDPGTGNTSHPSYMTHL